ncbi:adenylate cyclase type 10-like [Hylaeus anthracinus]|uniref:adenylate cyclase type 10-like n=1 Tax=Hylaeus anthracinus TaxID=313031 RepID=UPI0023B98E90|nr:adenylate cyclase type 10-like [Hylaeus anthracinus]
MATFVPDELIYEPDLTKKDFRKFNAVLALIDVSRFFDLYEKHYSAENGGSFALITLLNSYISVVVEEVYYTKGDVLKFSRTSSELSSERSGLLVMWKVNNNDFFSKMVHSVILNGQKILASIAMVKSKIAAPKADIAISAGELIFSVIGDDNSRHFVISGMPIEDLKHARRICLPGDLVLSSSAWKHCAPSQYEYVIKDSSNIKIIKVLGPPTEAENQQSTFSPPRPSEGNPSIDHEMNPDIISTVSDISLVSEFDLMPFRARVSTFEALKRRLGVFLETYMMASVLDQIVKDRPLEYLTEVKRVTVVSINVLPSKCSDYELISMVDQLYNLLQKYNNDYPNSIVQRYSGHVSVSNVYDKDILFCVLYGIKGYDSRLKDMNRAKRGVLSALEIMDEMKRVSGVKTVFIGISTGMAFCGVIGHTVRRQYMIFGTPVDKAASLMSISYGKMSCDYDTIFYSHMSKEKFRSRGMKTLQGFGKFHVYEVLDTYPYVLSGMTERPLNVEYTYPILGRVQEVEYFKDILDEIGVPGRTYSGLLIEGNERSGKSRLLDAFVTVVRNRQIKLVTVPLHLSHVEKEYAVLYEILLQLFDTVDCTTINDRERILLNKLTTVLSPNDFCYLNVIMRVQFPHSEEYCRDSDWKRHKKTVMIFQAILSKVVGNVCILLDDVQHMDVLSWQFLSAALERDNIVLAMTLLEPVSWDNLSPVEAGICEDKRLMNRSLVGLNSEYLAAFACQFLNVFAIPSSLEIILKKCSKNAISWCEAFLMSALQTEALTFITLSPLEVQHYKLVFPDSSLLAKIPADMTPEDVAPPMHWSQMSAIYVCIPSGRLLSFLETDRDVTGLRIDIYNRMNSYEQDFIKCAATLGGVFLRSMLETVMTNSAPLYTAKGKSAVAEMIKLRILECGMIQRKHFHMDESMFYLFKKRRTFSNMHHSEVCDCRPTRTFGIRSLPLNAHCKVLEFTIGSYRKLLYDILPPHEKKEYHAKAANILQRNARKCSTCGGGKFLAIFSKEDTISPSVEPMSSMMLSMQRRLTTLQSRSDIWESRRSIFQPDDNDALKRRESVNIRKISILPAITDSVEGVTFEPGKPTFSSSEPTIDVSWEGQLRQFNHIDYRNCRCSNAINYLFWNLHCHISSAMDVERLIKSMFEYTAGLIETAQFAFAIKFLATNSADIEIIKIKEHMMTNTSDTNITKGNTFILMGDAYMEYGYYSQAKKYYMEAAALRNLPLQTYKEVCYSTILERLRYMLAGFSSYVANRRSSQSVIETLETSVYMERLSTVLMLEEEPKRARLIVLQSLRSVFKCVGGFLEKGRIYITAVEIFRCYGYHDLLYSLEKPMMVAIETKTNWNSVEEMTLLADVYQRLFENR